MYKKLMFAVKVTGRGWYGFGGYEFQGVFSNTFDETRLTSDRQEAQDVVNMIRRENPRSEVSLVEVTTEREA